MEESIYKLVVFGGSLELDDSFEIVKFRNPKTHLSSLYAITHNGSKVLELLKHKPDFGCWFVNDHLSSDGGLLYITPIDPVYLVLPYLFKQSQLNPERFAPLEQILEDEDFLNVRNMRCFDGLQYLKEVTDFKDLEEFLVYRYSEEKCLKWLEKKVKQVVKFLENSSIQVNEGAQSSIFVRSKVERAQPEDYLKYAFCLISNYIDPLIEAKLRAHLGIPEETKPVNNENPSKKLKTMMVGSPLEDYSQGGVLVEKQTVQKLTATQKKFAKVDKSGMKSITSFFSVKTKTTKQ